MTLSGDTTVVLTPASSGCSLLESPELGPRSFGCNAWDDDLSWESEYGLKKPGTPANDCMVATTAITAAFDTEGCVDFFGFGEEAKLASNDEERILDDLLRLGLELGDLEDVFGNTDIDPSRSEMVNIVEENQGDVNGGEEAGQSETVVCAGPELVEDYAAEELLLAADLEDALLALPKDMPDEQDDDERAAESKGTDPLTTAEPDVIDEKALLAPANPSRDPPQVSPETTAASPSVAPDISAVESSSNHAADCASIKRSSGDAPDAVTLDRDNAAAGAVIPTITTRPSATATAAACYGDESGAIISPSVVAVADDAKNALDGDGSGSCSGDGSNSKDIDGVLAKAAPPGVPIHLLDAVELWESANAHKNNSTKKSGVKKKINEFGKRRRSSGAGGHAPGPCIALGLDSSHGAPPSLAAGRERRVKKDPLAAVKDVRNLSRKPLIVQWLNSDGCELDPEAESAVGKAVGKLSVIHSHYWSSGG